ncbi:MAG: DUF4012 domain-containing protein [Candidatus Levyibacteriota bacterium]
MPKHLIVEEEKEHKPTLLFVDTNSGQTNTLLNFLIQEFESKTKIYVLSQKKVSSDVEKISPLSIHFLDKLSGDLSYAVLFLDEEEQKKKVLQLITLLAGKKTRVLLLLPYRIHERFIDILLQCKEIKNITVGFLGDTFGKSNPTSVISKIIQNAFTNKEIVISNNALLSVFPISDSDVARGVSHLLFGRAESSHFAYLFYDHPQTLISLSHLLKRTEPDLSISFKENSKNEVKEKTQEQRDRYLKDRTGISPRNLSSSFIGFEKSVLEMQEQTTPNKENVKKTGHKNILRFQKSFFSRMVHVTKLLVTCLLLYAFIISALFFVGIFYYKQGISLLSAGDTQSAKNSFQISKGLYVFTRNTVFTAISLSPSFPNEIIKQNVFAYDDLMPITDDLLQVSESIKTANPHIGQKDFQQLMSLSIELYFLTQRYDIQNFKDVIQTDQYKNVSRFLPLSSVALSVMGYNIPKTYLLLFQNNNELRPTGGFIGSVGQVTLKDGVFEDVALQDVYDLDGQLKGHIDPPYIVRRFLQPHQYLRDSNFAPDFEETASLSALLYNLESNKKVDGVVAIDTDVLKKIVSVAGPITIPGYSKSITAQNVADIMQNTIQANYFPGSTQKKQLLQTLFSKITLNLESDKRKQLALLKALAPLILQKHILFSFADNSTQKAFIASGLAGSMSDLRISKNTLANFFSLNEANIGVNKANEFVTRKVTYSAFLKPAALDSDALLEYSNTGQEDYKAYIRLIVPKGAKLLSITIDGADQKIVPAVTNPLLYERKGFKPPVGLEVDQETQGKTDSFGFITTVSKTSSKRIRVLYENAGIIPRTGSFTYSLLYVKQPGTEPYPFTAQLQGDDSFQIKNTNQNSGPVLFDDTLSTDKEITATIIRTK